jgi:tetratricopeptide (TPR) repeat protein
MAFDKIIAMRNAERSLAQGKIRAAIAEYRNVVQHNPKDIGTTNLLGDLLVKDQDIKGAIECYRHVAEHYAKQGFAAKAIAIYNKIAKLRPGSPEISEKLAELYRQKGAASEAKSHYVLLAESYEAAGRTMEALAIWKEVALLDSKNTDVYQKIGETYLREGQNDEAADAFCALGDRFRFLNRSAEAVGSYNRAIELVPNFFPALKGLLEANIELGDETEIVELLEEHLNSNPHDREVPKLLIDCYLRTEKPSDAERLILKLVEYEPGNYALFLPLARLYLKQGDPVSASRMLTLSSEHLFVAGQSQEIYAALNEILELYPDQVEAIRLLCDFYTWERDEAQLIETLKRLAATTRASGHDEDERFAVSQLSMLVPHEAEHAERLRELNAANGYDGSEADESIFDTRFAKHLSATYIEKTDAPINVASENAFDFAIEGSNGTDAVLDSDVIVAADVSFDAEATTEPGLEFSDVAEDIGISSQTDDEHIASEIEGIRFYVDSGYPDLALKAARELRQDFGDRLEIMELFDYIAEVPAPPTAEALEALPQRDTLPETDNETIAQISLSGSFDLADLRSELGIEENSTEEENGDYETHYHTAIAYQEMGLLEEAINEFQHAIGLVKTEDGTRRFFQCANLLGHCFMEIGKPNLALKWYQRTLETADITHEEKQGLWYELANAFEADGDPANAARYFEMVYTENINFRDVGERLKGLAVAA